MQPRHNPTLEDRLNYADLALGFTYLLMLGNAGLACHHPGAGSTSPPLKHLAWLLSHLVHAWPLPGAPSNSPAGHWAGTTSSAACVWCAAVASAARSSQTMLEARRVAALLRQQCSMGMDPVCWLHEVGYTASNDLNTRISRGL
jgi:hypothetical protein